MVCCSLFSPYNRYPRQATPRERIGVTAHADDDDACEGSPARIGHDLLVTDDAELIRHMNAPGSRWTRSGWYDAMRMDPRQDSVFSTRNEKLHAELKAKEAGGVSTYFLEMVGGWSSPVVSGQRPAFVHSALLEPGRGFQDGSHLLHGVV